LASADLFHHDRLAALAVHRVRYCRQPYPARRYWALHKANATRSAKRGDVASKIKKAIRL
jgi:hypothetical protein